MITLEDSVEKIPATNTTKSSEQTTETDSEGGKRDSIREDSSTQIVNHSSDGSIVVLKEVNPNIKGVIVVADGAEDPIILEILYEAVKTVLGVSGNKVNVYSSK
jgi:stage III sporulation protein AG